MINAMRVTPPELALITRLIHRSRRKADTDAKRECYMPTVDRMAEIAISCVMGHSCRAPNGACQLPSFQGFRRVI